MTRLYVGLDVGGSAMKAGVVDDEGRARPSVTLPTEAGRGQEAGLARMCETIRAAVSAAGVSMADIAAVGVATPGLMDLKAGLITDPVNLRPWKNVPVRDHVAAEFGKPTAFQNDANAAALGECWAGAGKGCESLVFYTLGTGIGGGIVIGGRVVEGRNSNGGELGHIRIEMTSPRPCGCGRRGCLEAYAGAMSIVRRTHEALNSDGGKSSLHTVLRAHGELSARDVFAAWSAGDELGGRIVEETAYYLAIGAANAMHAIDPDMVVFGGGMTAAGEPFLDRIRHHVRTLAFPLPAERTPIRYAMLGTDAGFIGAACCARQLVV